MQQETMDITTTATTEGTVDTTVTMVTTPMDMAMDCTVEIAATDLKSTTLTTKNFPLIKMPTIMEHMVHTVAITVTIVITVIERSS